MRGFADVAATTQVVRLRAAATSCLAGAVFAISESWFEPEVDLSVDEQSTIGVLLASEDLFDNARRTFMDSKQIAADEVIRRRSAAFAAMIQDLPHPRGSFYPVPKSVQTA
ncbi:MAG TPA: hypothetical protein VK934_03325 [Fimbriimonas sp.]|nr:hypothetical protein [Fimbriimonas sp.]